MSPPLNAAARPHIGPKRILIVDDNESLLNVLRASLESHGFIVCGEARNGLEGIAKAVDSGPTW
jgi:CheY-like chemotaxis protein